MLTMLLALASIGDWVPMRWPSVDPSTLLLLRGTPVNCLLVNKVSVEFTESAKSMGVAVLLEFSKEGVVVDGPDKAKRAGMAGMVIAGARTEFLKSLDSEEFHVLSLPARYDLAVLPDSKLVGTWQGVWPGINQIDAADKAKAAPSGAPWIDTNSGFLRFVRAWTKAPVWIANRPPEKQVINPVRYLQAIADAAMCGARWVITLDSDLEQRLMTREVKAMQAWQRIGTLLTYIEVNKQWKNYLPGGKLAVIQDSSSGALLSGGILDMIAVKHTPAQPVPAAVLSKDSMRGAKMAVNVDPGVLNEQQRSLVTAFTKAGGMVLTSPPGWKFPSTKPGQVTVDELAVKQLDDIWKEMNTMTGRRNLGVRLFNVGSMLSNLLISSDEKTEVLHLVNYSDFPAESLTAHVLGTWKKATLLSPTAPPRKLDTYEVEDGTGIDVPLVHTFATVVLE